MVISSLAHFDDGLHIIRHEHPEQILCFFPRYLFCCASFTFSFSLFLCMIFDCVEEGTSGDVNLGVYLGMIGQM
jgi:hypothetical protein